MELKQLKEELKLEAEEIRVTRRAYKQAQRDGDYNKIIRYLRSLEYSCSDYRHKHIAYCMARGTLYEMIERKTDIAGPPDWQRINSLIKEVQHGEDVRVNQA